MKTLILKTNKRVLEVVKNNDGTITILNPDGTKKAGAGSFIVTSGGLDAVMARVIEFDGSLSDFIKKHTAEKIAEQHARKAQNDVLKAKWAEEHKAKWAAIKDLPVIPATPENIHSLLKELNTQNWGSWSLPKLSIGYKCAQYDCDGQTATTITLDKPIKVDEFSKPYNKFQVGAPFGHLNKYHRI